MAKKLGTAAVLKVGANAIANVKSVELAETLTAVDTTDNDSGGRKEYLPGDGDGTIAVVANYDPADTTGQGAVIAEFGTPTDGGIAFELGPQGTTAGLPKITFDANVTDLSTSEGHEEIGELSFTLQITGSVTRALYT